MSIAHRYLTRREAELFDILYRRGAATAVEILKQCEDSRNYSTVRTQLRVLEQKGQERLKAGARWRETGLLFTTFSARPTNLCGNGLHPRNVLRTLHRLLAAAGLPLCRFHDLRHSCASILIAQGVQLAEISQLLGQSALRFTAHTYGHLQQQTAARAAQHLDRVLR